MERKSKHILFQTIIYVVTYFCIRIFFPDVYVPEWVIHNNFLLYSWFVALVLILFNKVKAAYIFTIGSLVGILFGQLIGDSIVKNDLANAPKDLTAQQRYMLESHKGVFIYWAMALFFLIVGLFTNDQKKKNVKRKRA